MFSPRRNASSMPRFTFALRSWMKAAWYDDEIGSRSVACGFELSNPSMAPTSRTLISVASSKRLDRAAAQSRQVVDDEPRDAEGVTLL